jgi:hypothetical protein
MARSTAPPDAQRSRAVIRPQQSRHVRRRPGARVFATKGHLVSALSGVVRFRVKLARIGNFHEVISVLRRGLAALGQQSVWIFVNCTSKINRSQFYLRCLQLWVGAAPLAPSQIRRQGRRLASDLGRRPEPRRWVSLDWAQSVLVEINR